MNYTDTQLQLALAKMLPERLCIRYGRVCWGKDDFPGELPMVQDSELLHICWLIEQTLPVPVQINYMTSFKCVASFGPALPYMLSTWQQRAIALAKVKGVEIV